MLTIYTTPSCTSCRKTKKWFDEYKIKYKEKCLGTVDLTQEEINIMFLLSKNGFDEIISTRSNIYKQYGISIDKMRSGQLIQFIIDNPTLLKRPIIIDTDENKMQIGFNEEDIREFIPNKIKHAIVEYYLADTPEESNWEEGLTEDEKVQAMSLIETTFTKKKDKSDSYDDDEDYVEVDEEDEIILDGDDLNEDID